MKLQPDRMDTLAVTGYGPGWIAVNGERHQHSLLITSKGLLQPWRPATFEALEPADFAMLTELGVELAVFGSGSRLRFIPPGTAHGLSPGVGNHGYPGRLPHLQHPGWRRSTCGGFAPAGTHLNSPRTA